ncbi:mitochondrial dynamin GTPase Msp1 [Conglomerata obtusa]
MRNLILRRKKAKEQEVYENNDLLYMLKETKNPKLSKDITIDLLEYLLYRRMNQGKSQTQDDKKKQAGGSSIIYIILGVLTLGAIIFQIIKQGGGPVSQEPYTITDDFRDFAYLNIYGKDQLLMEVVAELSRMNRLLIQTDKQLLYKLIKPIGKNFLLYGPPGTGKTLFIKKLSFLLDIEIKLSRELKRLGREAFAKKKYTLEELQKLPPGAILITVQPSSLVDKFVGSTEKNINRLYATATTESQRAPVIVFIDEIDVFFSERNSNTPEYSISAKTEFLCVLDGMRTKLEDKIFTFGATNFQDKMDDAFIRRLGIQIEFKLPGSNERYQIIIKNMETNEWYNKQKIENLVKITKGMSPNQITNAFQELIRKTGTTQLTFTYEQVEAVFIKYNNVDGKRKLMPTDLSLSKEQADAILYPKIVAAAG